MSRQNAIDRLASSAETFDLLIMGGGATGFACAIDGLSRGYSVALVERGDFGEGTSSRSTKLIHGGVRYLRQGNVKFVRESLRERNWFFRAASHLVKPMEFVIPCHARLEQLFYRAGMAVYDRLAHAPPGDKSAMLTAANVSTLVPGCTTERLFGGVRYIDGQFDDARMIITFLRHIMDAGGVALNHAPAVELTKENGRVSGAVIQDEETGIHHRIKARVVINATGVFTDNLCRLDQPDASSKVTASQGIHLVFDKAFLGGNTALMIPKTSDNRVLFAIPWHDRVLLGTTDTPWPDANREPTPLKEEIDYLLEHARTIFSKAPSTADIRGMFAGLRPLPKPQDPTRTSSIRRDFHVEVSVSGLVSVYGGKWTTCRAMGEATINKAADVGHLFPATSRSASLVFAPPLEPASHLQPPEQAWVTHAVHHEMATTLSDLLLRRCRLGVLDVQRATAEAPRCAHWMAEMLHKDATWIERQLESFQREITTSMPPSRTLT